MMKDVIELAKMAFAGTSDEELVSHYNDIMKDLRLVMQLNITPEKVDAKGRHVIQASINQAMSCEVEIVRRGLGKKEELNFNCGGAYDEDEPKAGPIWDEDTERYI